MTREEFNDLQIVALGGLQTLSWHWFSYHFSTPPSPFALGIMRACASIDRRASGIGADLLRELMTIGGLDRYEPHYEQLLQKLAEILIIERIVTSEWPSGTTFEHEPAAIRGGPRPELLVTFGGGRLVVEVKTPSLLSHIRRRSENGTQLPYRGLPLDQFARQLGRKA